jgi:hypothetical protein
MGCGWAMASPTRSSYLEYKMKKYVHLARLFLLMGCAYAAGAFAANEPIAGFGVPLTNESLQDYRGGFDNVKNDLQLSGTVADNLARNVITGNNSIADGSFANSSGFPIVIQNSGANVLIQNATIINIQY